MRFALFLISLIPVFGQAVTVGATGGVPVTDTFDTGGIHAGASSAQTIRYNVGPSVDFRLFGPVRAEIDALYQPFSFRTFNEADVIPTYSHTTGSLWQFPALIKVRIPTPVLKPFVDAGPSVELATNVVESSYNLGFPSQIATQHPGPNAVAGFTAGGGFEFHLYRLVLAPELRYTHWFDQNFNFGNPNLGTHQNEVQVLLSIRL